MSFSNQKEMLTALIEGKTLIHKKSRRTVCFDKYNNIVCGKGTPTGMPSIARDWEVLHETRRILLYARVKDCYRSDRFVERQRLLGLAVRSIGAIAQTIEGSEDHRELDRSKEYQFVGVISVVV